MPSLESLSPSDSVPLIAAVGGDGGEQLGGLPTFAWLVVIAFGVNITVFVPSFRRQDRAFL